MATPWFLKPVVAVVDRNRGQGTGHHHRPPSSLSTGGLRCVLDQPTMTTVGQPLTVELELEGQLRAAGRIAYRDDDGTLGIQFDVGDTGVAEHVERYLNRTAA